MTNEETIEKLKAGEKFFFSYYKNEPNLKNLYFYKERFLFEISSFTIMTEGDYDKEYIRKGTIEVFSEEYFSVFNIIGNKVTQCQILYNEIEFENDGK